MLVLSGTALGDSQQVFQASTMDAYSVMSDKICSYALGECSLKEEKRIDFLDTLIATNGDILSFSGLGVVLIVCNGKMYPQ